MANFVEHASNDADDQSRALDGWRQRYQQLSRGRFQGRAWQVMLEGGAFVREWTNLHVSEHITPPPDHLVLAIPMAVAPGSSLAGRPLARESLLVLGANEEHNLVSTGEMDLVGLAVHRSLLADLAPTKLIWLRQAESECNLSLSPDAASAIRQLLLLVGGLTQSAAQPTGPTIGGPGHRLSLEEPSGAGQPRFERELLQSTLLQTVLLAMHSDTLAHIPRRAENRHKVVKRAVDFMRAHLHQDIGVSDMCAAACASRRSLQYCFEELLQTTPQAYLRSLRLNEARRAIKARGDGAIQAIALDLGFGSASHFTRCYKNLFDELPSDTVRGALKQPNRTQY